MGVGGGVGGNSKLEFEADREARHTVMYHYMYCGQNSISNKMLTAEEIELH